MGHVSPPSGVHVLGRRQNPSHKASTRAKNKQDGYLPRDLAPIALLFFGMEPTQEQLALYSTNSSNCQASLLLHSATQLPSFPRSPTMPRLQWRVGRRPCYRYRAIRFQEGTWYACGGIWKTRTDCEEFTNVVLRPMLVFEPPADRAVMIKKVIAWT